MLRRVKCALCVSESHKDWMFGLERRGAKRYVEGWEVARVMRSAASAGVEADLLRARNC